MSLWILDTDHVSLFLEGNPQIREQAAGKFPNVAITIKDDMVWFKGAVLIQLLLRPLRAI